MTSPNDQLEREVEDFLARSAARAVPDSRRAPAPPWHGQQRRTRTADVRRFGRATPWLVAAVLLVIAGLAIGASVGFDASGPDRRGPAVTDPPSPVPTDTAPDATPTTPGATSSSHPSLSRNANSTGPDDGVDLTGAGIGRYGPVLVGMTADQAWAALGVTPGNPVSGGLGPTCSSAVPMPGTGLPGRPPEAILDNATGKVIAFFTRYDTVDAAGNGAGSTLAQLEATYPSGQLLQRQGWTFTVVDNGGNGLGFAFGVDRPTATSTVSYLLPGTAAYASGDELCVG